MTLETGEQKDTTTHSTQFGIAAAWGPASLSNLGPGFDVLGVAVQGIGDRVHLETVDNDQFTVRILGPEWISDLPENEELNTAAVSARRVFRAADLDIGAQLTIYKGVPLGSGIGGSAASAVAGAVAANDIVRQLTGKSLAQNVVARCALAGERVASGAIHGDNVMPALVGGLVLVDPTDPQNYVVLGGLRGCSIVLVLPTIRILTKTARAILPDSVRLSSVSAQAYRLSNMLDALVSEDWERAGRAMMSDELVEPYRAAQVNSFAAVRESALEAGAFACGLSGSGPAIFALIPPGSKTDPIDVGEAMLNPLKRQNATARIICTLIDHRGARLIDQPLPNGVDDL